MSRSAKDMTLHCYQQMRTALASLVEIPDEQWGTLTDLFQVQLAEKHEYVALPGARTYKLFFVCEGILRLYFVTSNGMESNQAFAVENMFAGSPAAYAMGLPAFYGVQALEPTVLLVAPYARFVALFDEHPIFDRLGRKLFRVGLDSEGITDAKPAAISSTRTLYRVCSRSSRTHPACLSISYCFLSRDNRSVALTH